MTSPELEVVNCMARNGGSFVKALATAFRHADSVNFQRLKMAFPEYWLEYAGMVERNLQAEIKSLQPVE